MKSSFIMQIRSIDLFWKEIYHWRSITTTITTPTTSPFSPPFFSLEAHDTFELQICEGVKCRVLATVNTEIKGLVAHSFDYLFVFVVFLTNIFWHFASRICSTIIGVVVCLLKWSSSCSCSIMARGEVCERMIEFYKEIFCSFGMMVSRRSDIQCVLCRIEVEVSEKFTVR